MVGQSRKEAQVQVSLCTAVCGGGWGVGQLMCWLGDTLWAGEAVEVTHLGFPLPPRSPTMLAACQCHLWLMRTPSPRGPCGQRTASSWTTAKMGKSLSGKVTGTGGTGGVLIQVPRGGGRLLNGNRESGHNPGFAVDSLCDLGSFTCLCGSQTYLG